MITARTIRRELDSHVRSAGDERQGRINFIRQVHESVGVLTRDESGALIESVDEYGRPKVASGCLKPEEYSFREMAQGIGGNEFLEFFDPHNRPGSDDILQEAGPGIDPTTFANISMFNSLNNGVISAKVMAEYDHPAYIGDQLVTVMPTKLNGEKIPGTFGFHKDDGDSVRKPGEPHARAGIGERWIKTPELDEKALAIEVTQEAVFYDQTNTVLKKAGQVGEALGYGRERTILKMFCGAVNPYNYNDVGYNTYLTSGSWINDQSNPAVDYTSLDTARELANKMTDPETGREIITMANTLVYDPDNVSLWNNILRGTETRETTNSGNRVTIAPPPPSAAQQYTELHSQILRNVLINDLGLSEANAKKYWFYGQPSKAFLWMEAWPLRVRQASANEFVMLDRGLIAAYFANHRGAGAVEEPRHMIRNKN